MNNTKIVITVEGGLVVDVKSSNPNIEYVVIDKDFADADISDKVNFLFDDNISVKQILEGYQDEAVSTLTEEHRTHLQKVLDHNYEYEHSNFEEFGYIDVDGREIIKSLDEYAVHEFNREQKRHMFYHWVQLSNMLSSMQTEPDYTFELSRNAKNLVIRMGSSAKVKTQEMLSTSSHTDFDFLDKLLEAAGVTPLGQLYRVLPENVGALTDAPIIGTSQFLDEADSTENEKVWWYPDYAVTSFAEQLILNGIVVFTASPQNK